MLEVNQISVYFDDKKIISSLSFTLEKGEIGCLLGHSGCGKTTALRTIAGFEPVRAGQIAFNGEVISSASVMLPAYKRQMGMVFQDYALFPHLSVAQNIAFGLYRLDKKAQTDRVNELLELIGLTGYAQRYPHELSGGQQQRVALARALAPRPHLILLDEPFSSLDADMRTELCQQIRRILKEEGVTALLVTHDQKEAFYLSDKIGVMAQGFLQQWSAPHELYHYPQNRIVAEFIGDNYLIQGKRLAENKVLLPFGEYICTGEATGEQVLALVRQKELSLTDKHSSCMVTVCDRYFQAGEDYYTVRLPESNQTLQIASTKHYEIGQKLSILLTTDQVLVFSLN